MSNIHVPIETVTVGAYTIPTDVPESDGTLAWDSTGMVLVEISAGGVTGLGYTYGHPACATLIESKLAGVVKDRNAMNTRECWEAMVESIRNLGRPGICSMAISAIDVALWDLKARLLDVPLITLLGAVRPAVDIYGSGGFTSYTLDQLREQLSRWVDEGIPRIKMKVGRHPSDDPERIRVARETIGPQAELFVDANGAWLRKQSLAMAEVLAEHNVSWYEEPVTSDDLAGLRLLRDRVPAGIEISAGEYGYDLPYFKRMLDAEAVDVLQADATRCGGITGFLDVAALCRAWQRPFSGHTAPAIHLHPGCSHERIRHLEYFHDHARIESMLFDGVVEPVDGQLKPDTSRPGLGLTLRREEAERYRTSF